MPVTAPRAQTAQNAGNKMGIPHLRSPDRRASGFTLVELMTVLAIATILLGLGIPSFQSLMQNQRITTTANDLFASIALTRSEAIQRGTRVDLVPVEGDWHKGWVVFIDEDDDQRPGDGEPVLFKHGAVPQGMEVRVCLTNTDGSYLAYHGTGRTRTNASAAQPLYGSFSFTLGDLSRKININMLGRARVCNPATSKSC